MRSTTIGTSSTASRTYDEFSRAWLGEARRILKDDGTIWVIGSYHNIFRVGALLQDAGYLDPERHRVAQVQPDAQFPRHPLHQRARDADLVRQGRERALHLQLSRDEGAQRRPPDALRLGAADLRRARSGTRTTTATRRTRRRSPRALLYRILLACTKPGDVVLDPFFGTGTTGAVARRLGRRWIGIEREAAYVEGRAGADRRDPAARRKRDDDDGRQALGAAGRVRPAGRKRAGSGRDQADRRQAPVDRHGPRRRVDRLRTRIRARSTRSAPRCRMRRRATAGPSGTSIRAARCSRSTRCGKSICPRYSAAPCARSSAPPPSSIRRSAMTARSRGSPAG